MHDFIITEDSELWDVICDGPFVPMKTIAQTTVTVRKTRKEYNDADRKAIEKNFRAKKIFICGIGPDEYNRISACQSAKEIWEALQTAHEGTTQVKHSEIDMLTTEYELFKMKEDEFIQDMHTRFTSIINELHSLGEIIPRNKLVRKILTVLPGSYESKVNAIMEKKYLQKLTIDELIGNLKTYKMKKKKFKRRDAADNVLKKALAAWGDSSSESEDDDEQGDTSMMAAESEAAEYDSTFALMAKSDEDEDDDDDDNEVNFLDVQINLKSYSQKKLLSLTNVLIDAYHNLINDKNALTEEIGEIEHERDDLLVVVLDLKETMEELKKEKYVLTKRIGDIEHERDDLLVVVVDLKELVEELKRENNSVKTSMENCINSSKGKEVASEAHLKLSRFQSQKKNKIFVEKVSTVKEPGSLKENYTAVKESSQRWYMDSGCSKHMTESTDDFLSLKSLQGGSVSFGNGKKGYILGIGKVGKILTYSIENAYYVNALKYNFLNFESLNSGDLICLSVVGVDAELWHRRLGHASFSLLNKIIKKDLIRGLPKSKFKDYKDETFPVFAAFVKQIQVKMSHNVVSIRSDHGTEFDNAKFDEFYAENGISHNFLTPKTPQKNRVVERKIRTLEDIVIDSGIPKSF
ncbi:uncharacterized protein LOC107780968 [Nicotiana tabacum]|uniref:Uncharacterized protein LOC107780968 n=1 Tax=Nicotiana tabacum TaxID=4097 RepID=A0AC58UBK8_TOBAC